MNTQKLRHTVTMQRLCALVTVVSDIQGEKMSGKILTGEFGTVTNGNTVGGS
jgi:hypothetical protein